jgi:hypothetical protein
VRAVFRQVNERIRVVSEQLFLATTADGVELLCECDSANCTERILVPLAMFDAICSEASVFVVARGHEASDAVRETYDGFAVVTPPPPRP